LIGHHGRAVVRKDNMVLQKRIGKIKIPESRKSGKGVNPEWRLDKECQL